MRYKPDLSKQQHFVAQALLKVHGFAQPFLHHANNSKGMEIFLGLPAWRAQERSRQASRVRLAHEGRCERGQNFPMDSCFWYSGALGTHDRIYEYDQAVRHEGYIFTILVKTIHLF